MNVHGRPTVRPTWGEGGTRATDGGEVLTELRRRDATGLADEFHALDAAFVVPGADGMTVATYVVPPAPAVSATSSISTHEAR